MVYEYGHHTSAKSTMVFSHVLQYKYHVCLNVYIYTHIYIYIYIYTHTHTFLDLFYSVVCNKNAKKYHGVFPWLTI